MRFNKYIPCAALQPYIKHFAISEEDDEQVYRVLPGTSLVLGFQYRGSLKQVSGFGEDALATSGVTGLLDTYRLFKNSKNIGTVLVFFKETGASGFLRVPLNELFLESLSLDIFFPRSLMERVEEQLAEANDDRQRIAIVESFLLSQLCPTPADGLVAEAVRLIKQSNGTMRISELAGKLHTSQSPLEKRFRKAVGATPKKFSSIIRLNSIIINRHCDSGSLAGLGYAAGYFDQAHFIKDFKAFTGETPEKFFSASAR